MPGSGIGGTDIRVEEMAKRIGAPSSSPPPPKDEAGTPTWRPMRKPMGKRKTATRKTKAKTEPAEEPSSENKQRFTLTVDPKLLDEMRNAVSFHAGDPEHLTISGLVERAVRAELDWLKDEYHKGKAFPKRSKTVRRGRPPTS